MNYTFFQRPALVFSLAGLTFLTCLEVSIFVATFCFVMWAWRWLADSNFIAPLSRKMTTALSFFVLAYIFIEYRSLFVQEASSGLLVALAALKVMDYSNRRDHLLLILLGFLLLTLKPLYGLELYLLPVQLICMISLFWALSQDPRRLPRSVLGKIFIASIPIALILFLVFPRVVLPWAMSQNRTSARMGFSTDLNPGQVAELASSNALVMRAQFPQEAEVNSRDLYWRGALLTTSKGLAWKDAKLIAQSSTVSFQPEKTPVTYEVVIEPGNGTVIFALDQTYQLKSYEGGVIAFENSIWRSRSSATSSKRYIGTLSEDFKNTEPPDRSDLKYPELPPRSQKWIDEVRSQKLDVNGRIHQLRNLFGHPEFVYTLSPGVYSENDLDEFLFNKRRGFCEHYAGAYATLARALGIPARVVSGYQGGQYNALGGFWRVTQKNAHAWVEIWDGKLWQRIDPTTWATISEFSRDPQKGFFEWVDEGYDTYEALNYRWTTFLLDFDRNSQSLALREWLPRIFIAIILGLVLFFLLKLVRGWLRVKREGSQKLLQNQLSALMQQIRDSEEEYLNQDLSAVPPLEIIKLAQKHSKEYDAFYNKLSAFYDGVFYEGREEDENFRSELQYLQKKWLDIQILSK